MKKIYLMGITAAFVMSVNAQTTIKIKNPSNKGEFKNASAAKGGSPIIPAQITGGIVCNTQYTAGVTMDLMFTVDLTNTDSEYGDLIVITFPIGITPNTSAANTPSIGTGAAYIEMLNPIAGQVISWGNNDNIYGGIVPGITYTLNVNVTIGAGVTGNQNVTYDVSGDTYGGVTAGDLIGGTCIVFPAGTAVVDMKTKFVVPTTITAINNCAMGMSPIYARFINLSTLAQSNFPVNYSVNGVASTGTVIPGPLAVGDSVDVTFATPFDFTPSNMYIVKAWVSQASDVSMNNDTASLIISNSFPTTLTNTVTPYINGIESAYDFGSINKLSAGTGVPFDQSFATFRTGAAALFYTIPGNAPAGVYETFAILPCVDVTSSEIYKISYWRKANTSGTLTVNGESAVFTGSAQDVASMTTVLKPYSAITPNIQAGTWTKDSVNFIATANETRYFAIVGRGTIAGTSDQINVRIDDITITKLGTVGIKKNSSTEAISMFPNPTSGILNVTSVEVTSSIEVFNVIGEKVYTGNLVKGNNVVDLSGLSNGAYFVKMNSNNQVITKKVVLSK